MNTGQSHVSHKFLGQEYGWGLAGWLKLYGQSHIGRRVAKLLEGLQTLMNIWPDEETWEPHSWEKAERRAAGFDRLRKQGSIRPHKEANSLLRQTQKEFARLFPAPVFCGFKVRGGVKRMDFRRFKGRATLPVAIPADCIENLGKLGLLERIRRCPRCQRWLFARFRHQIFCSTNCQQAHYKSSEEWKRHRREWMKNHRRVKSRALIKGEGI